MSSALSVFGVLVVIYMILRRWGNRATGYVDNDESSDDEDNEVRVSSVALYGIGGLNNSVDRDFDENRGDAVANGAAADPVSAENTLLAPANGVYYLQDVATGRTLNVSMSTGQVKTSRGFHDLMKFVVERVDDDAPGENLYVVENVVMRGQLYVHAEKNDVVVSCRVVPRVMPIAFSRSPLVDPPGVYSLRIRGDRYITAMPNTHEVVASESSRARWRLIAA